MKNRITVNLFFFKKGQALHMASTGHSCSYVHKCRSLGKQLCVQTYTCRNFGKELHVQTYTQFYRQLHISNCVAMERRIYTYKHTDMHKIRQATSCTNIQIYHHNGSKCVGLEKQNLTPGEKKKWNKKKTV